MKRSLSLAFSIQIPYIVTEYNAAYNTGVAETEGETLRETVWGCVKVVPLQTVQLLVTEDFRLHCQQKT